MNQRLLSILAGFGLVFVAAVAYHQAHEEPSTYIQGGQYWDGSTFRPNPGILIRNHRIVDLDCVAYERSEVVDAAGLFIMPGLIDSHVHLHHRLAQAGLDSQDVLPLYFQSGITTLRDIGDDLGAQYAAKFLSDRHRNQYPDIILCSPFLDEGSIYHPQDSISVTVWTVRRVIDSLPSQVRTVKLYAGVSRVTGIAAIQEAHARGMLVAGHLDVYPVSLAVMDGIDCIEHLLPIALQIYRWQGKGEPPAARAQIDLNDPRVQELIALMAARGTFVDPSLVVMRNCDLLPDDPHLDFSGAPSRLQSHWREWLRSTPLNALRYPYKDREAEFQAYLRLTRELHRHGVRLLAGSDSPEHGCVPGESLHRELELLCEAGLSPRQAIKCATENAADCMRLPIGRIAVDCQADLLFLDGDPSNDINELRHIRHVRRY